MPAARVLDRVPSSALFVFSGLTQYAGAAVAVSLFIPIGPPQTAWLRIAFSALMLLAWRRPWRRRWTRRDVGAAVFFGTALAAMNISFYIAIDHLPLGTAVAIEFLGPVAVAAVTGRSWRERVAIAVAAGGVILLAGVTLRSDIPRADAVTGLVAIGVAALCWAAYIVLGRRVATTGSGVSGLAVAMTAGAVVFAPFLGFSAVTSLSDAGLVAKVAAVAFCSSVVPYALEQVILRRVSTAQFAVLLALLPATATVIGAVMLRQVPSIADFAGLALVSLAIAMTAGSGPAPKSTGRRKR